MAINFPNSPSAGDPHSEAGINWVYDGEKWVAQSEATFWARTSSTLSPSTAGDSISTTGNLSVAAGTFSGTLLVGADSLSVTSTAILQGNSGDANGPAILRLGTKEAAPSDTNASIGGVYFAAANQVTAAAVEAQPTGGTWTPGSSHPTKLVFRTTENGASTSSERMWIDGGGAVKVGGTIDSPNITLNANGGAYFGMTPDAMVQIDRDSGSEVDVLRIRQSGTIRIRLTTTGGAYKPGGGSWSVQSDQRIKTNVKDYITGLDALKQLRPVTYTHLSTGEDYVGFLAQEVEGIMPEMVTLDKGQLADGTVVDDFRYLNTSAMDFAMLNAIKEMATRIEALEAEVQSLKGGS